MSVGLNSIPDFDANGNLPPGEHRATLANIKEKFTWTQKRKNLFDGLEKAVKNLRDAGVWKFYIDGSFTTIEDNPSDIDGCWVPNKDVDMNIIDPVFRDPESPQKKMREKYGVDLLIVGFDVGRVDTQPIAEFLQRDRDGNAKGILLIEY